MLIDVKFGLITASGRDWPYELRLYMRFVSPVI